MKTLFHGCLASAAFVAILQIPADACTLTSQIHGELKIKFVSKPNYAFVQGFIYDGVSKLGFLGDWVCSTGGTCSTTGGAFGDPAIIGMRNGKPTNGTSYRPSVYLFSGLSLGDKWNTRSRSASRGLWLRGKTCVGPWYDRA